MRILYMKFHLHRTLTSPKTNLIPNFDVSVDGQTNRRTDRRTVGQVPYVTGNLKHSYNEDTICEVSLK